MTEKEDLEYFRAKGLLPFQARIALNFLKSEDKRYWEVVAPLGTGKTRLAVALIAHELKESANKRILVLAPTRTLLIGWQSELLSFGSPFTAQACSPRIVDRKTYLELESSVPVGQSPWPIPAIILMSIDLAKREDMAANLSSVPWDLVIFDESHILIGKRKTLFDRLTESGAIRRALLLTAVETQLPSDVVTKVRVGYENVIDWNGQPVFVSFEKKVKPVYYRRTEEEQSFLGELQAFADQLAKKWPYGKWQKKIILQVASSSIYATEGTLRRLADSWRPMRNKISHGMPWVDEDFKRVQRQLSMVADDPWVVNELFGNRTIQAEEFLILYQKLESLLRQMEEIEADPKLDALIAYVRERRKSKEKPYFCIWSSFANTVEYLSSSVQDLGMPVYSLTSALELVERMRKLETFRKNGGVLFLTEVASEGLSLQYVEECINYDLPTDPRMFEQRWGRFIRFGRKTEFKMVVFIDQSKALFWEEEQLKALKDIALDENNI